MNRWLVRFVALLVVTAVALGAGFSSTAAAEGAEADQECDSDRR